MPPAASKSLRIWNQGAPIGTPSALASLVRLTPQIIVRQHHDGHARQVRPKHALAAAVEGIVLGLAKS